MARNKHLPLSASQVRLIQELATVTSMSRPDIAKRYSDIDKVLAPRDESLIFSSDDYDDCLISQGLVYSKEVEEGGRSIQYYSLTSEGKAAARKYITKHKDTSEKIPTKVLDAAVLPVKETRTYQFEKYSEGDLEEVARNLPVRYRDINIESLRNQMINRRKVGAYKKEEDLFPQWYLDYRTKDHWQTVMEEAMDVTGDRCSINNDHSEGVDVYHRRVKRFGLSTIGEETKDDVVVLCKGCYNKLKKSLPTIPNDPTD